MPKRKSNRTTSTAAESKRGNEDSKLEVGAHGGDNDDEATVLWKKLKETQHKKMKQLEEETEQLQNGKDTMLNSVMLVASAASPAGTNTAIPDDDIITVNTGGKLITALRSTLTLPSNTMWSYMFSGRWDESLKRDSDGRIFLDYNHELIAIIVDYLREKKIEDPAKPLKYPYVPPYKKESFQRLLEYFGLVDYFKPPPSSSMMIFSENNFVQNEGRDYVTVTENDKNTIKLHKRTETGQYAVAFTTELDPSGEGCFWKVNIDSLPKSAYFFLGIAGNLSLKHFIQSFEVTSFGWDGDSFVFRKGNAISGKDGFTGFADRECLYFHFKSNKLSMHSIQKNKTFIMYDIDANATKYYFHINIVYPGTLMTIGPLNAEERKIFTDNE